jgi:hypothetical protein
LNPSPELVKQVAEELKEIQNAPPIAYGVSIPTCHFCGQVIPQEEAVHIETVGEHRRFKGGCCAGSTNRKPQEVRRRI